MRCCSTFMIAIWQLHFDFSFVCWFFVFVSVLRPLIIIFTFSFLSFRVSRDIKSTVHSKWKTPTDVKIIDRYTHASGYIFVSELNESRKRNSSNTASVQEAETMKEFRWLAIQLFSSLPILMTIESHSSLLFCISAACREIRGRLHSVKRVGTSLSI